MATIYADLAMPDLKFDLEDDLSTSDLRKVDQWESRLSEAGKLRVQRNGRVLGVLVSPTAWRAFKEQTEFYERALRLVENERDLQLITQREGGGPLLRGRELSVALERELTRDALR
jgi:hypothetical protein